MKRIARLTAVLLGVRQHRNDLQKFGNRTGPAVGHQKWQSVRVWRACVKKMGVPSSDGNEELVELVESGFFLTPIKGIKPMVNERPQGVLIRSILPRLADVVWPASR